MLCGLACAFRELLAAELHRRHVGHIFVVDDEVDGVVSKGQAFAVGMGAGAGPAAGLRAFGLELQERARDIQRNVLNALFLEGQ